MTFCGHNNFQGIRIMVDHMKLELSDRDLLADFFQYAVYIEYNDICLLERVIGFDVTRLIQIFMDMQQLVFDGHRIYPSRKIVSKGRYLRKNTVSSILQHVSAQSHHKLISDIKIFIEERCPQEFRLKTILLRFIVNILKSIRLDQKSQRLVRDFVELCILVEYEIYRDGIFIEKALSLFYKARALAFYSGDMRNISAIDTQIGSYFYNTTTNTERIARFDRAMRDGIYNIFKINDLDIIVKNVYNISRYYMMSGEYSKSKSIFYFYLTLQRSEFPLAFTAWLLGQVAYSDIFLGEFDDALRKMKYSLCLSTDIGNHTYRLYSLLMISYIFICKNDIDIAKRILHDIKYDAHINDVQTSVLFRIDCTEAYLAYREGDIQTAYQHYTKNLELFSTNFIFVNDHISLPFRIELLVAFDLADFPNPHGNSYADDYMLATKIPCRYVNINAYYQLSKRACARAAYDEAVRYLSSALEHVSVTQPEYIGTEVFNFGVRLCEKLERLTIEDKEQYILTLKKVLDRYNEKHKNNRCSVNSVCEILIKKIFYSKRDLSCFSTDNIYFIFINIISVFSGFRCSLYRKSGTDITECVSLDLRKSLVGHINPHDVSLIEKTFSEQKHQVFQYISERMFSGDDLDNCIVTIYFCRRGEEYAAIVEYYGCKESDIIYNVCDMLALYMESELPPSLITPISADASPRMWNSSSKSEDRFVYTHSKMKDLITQIDRLAQTEATILIRGETGVGKELIAKRIHRQSKVRGEFIPVNMASISEQLWESEFFGHEKGSFTGAVTQKIGLLELAHGGTLFIDEVGDIPLPMQIKLLRVLQEKTFMRVGGTKIIKSDFRLISASHINLEEAISRKEFREDLFYRINAIPFHIPPLRERPDDILEIAKYYSELYSKKYKLPVYVFSAEEREFLCSYRWPGNTRELKNFVERIILLAYASPGKRYDSAALLCLKNSEKAPGNCPRLNLQHPEQEGGSDFVIQQPISLEGLKQQYFEWVYVRKNGLISGAEGVAAALGVSANSAYSWVRKYGLHAKYSTILRRNI